MRNIFANVVFATMILLTIVSCNKTKYDYQTVEGDDLKTLTYTLPNGLKVFMSVNPESPRIQTFIAVHAGSKHEPEETTGLAHYLEHMLFKGSANLGTTNYEKEKVLLDKIADLYEVYRKTSDPQKRTSIYHEIDSVSYEASTYFIPNEYDKVMSHIGSDGSNAFTSYDETVYVEDIPSNQIESWAKVQSDRFKNMVLRGFHTELEAVYEEYNMYLNNDNDKIMNAIFKTHTPTHPYSHSVIGLGEHLKNPSIKNIEAFFHKYYVPNNMAICLSGDFNPDEMIDILTKYFGDMEPNKDLQMPIIEDQPVLTSVVEREIITPNPESITLSWRFDGANSHEIDTLEVLSQILHNGNAGLFDLNLNLPQKVNSSETQLDCLCDYSVLSLVAQPQSGQSLEDLRQLLMEEVKKLREGDFSEELVQSVITEKKLSQQQMLESNLSRAMEYVQAFINDCDWKDYSGKLQRMSQLKKEDIVAFAQRHLADNNYVCVYKRIGEDTSIKPVEKPAITPIQMNRDTVSSFAKDILEAEVAPIEPVFVDLEKDITYLNAKSNLPVLYRHNDLNDVFVLTYRFDNLGTASLLGDGLSRYLPLASEYIQYLGTDSLSAQEIHQKFYLLGCEMSITSQLRTTTITLSGLQENMATALNLMEYLINNAKPDEEALRNLVMTKMQDRQNFLNMFDYYSYFLRTYLFYGLAGVEQELTNQELLASVSMSDTLARMINGFPRMQHTITYYGPMESENLVDLLNKEHIVPEKLIGCLEIKLPELIKTDEDECFVFPYNGTTSFVMSQYACNGKPWDENKLGVTYMYNNYFGAGMNTVVFQEMREKRSLCYGASARYNLPDYRDKHCTFFTTIQSQNDKLSDCITVFDDIVNNMPVSQTSFDVARQGVITQLRTERVKRTEYFDTYFTARDLGIKYDIRKKIYEQLQDITLQDVVDFQKDNVCNLYYRSVFAGDPKGLDAKELSRLGSVKMLTPHEVFGY